MSAPRDHARFVAGVDVAQAEPELVACVFTDDGLSIYDREGSGPMTWEQLWEGMLELDRIDRERRR